MALALADSLITCAAINEQDLMTRFVTWWEQGAYSSTGSCFDIGMTVRGALQRFKRSGNPIAGSTDPMSAGNGSLMRLSPVPIRYWNDREALRDAAARQSKTTHGAAEAVDACVAFSDMLADAIAGKRRSEVLHDRGGDCQGAIGDILSGSWRGKPRTAIKSSGYVAHSLEAALWCVGRTGSFSDAVVLAANFLEATLTPLRRSLASSRAHCTATGYPDPLAWSLHDEQMIHRVATRLFDHSQGSLARSRP